MRRTTVLAGVAVAVSGGGLVATSMSAAGLKDRRFTIRIRKGRSPVASVAIG